MKYEFSLKTFQFCNIGNTIIIEKSIPFHSINDLIYFIKNKLYNDDDMFYYGKYLLDVKSLFYEKTIREYLEQYIKDVEEFENQKIE